VNNKVLKILLVDDEPDHVELIRRSLRDASFAMQLSVAGSLAEAQQFLSDNTPDIMVVDVRLPDGEGTELLPGDVEKRSMPIVILTGHGDEKIAAAAMRAGALDYIVKSDDSLNDIPHIIERTMREWEHIIGREQAEEERIKIQRLINQTSDVVFLCDDKANVLYVNHAAEPMAGLKVDDMIGKPFAPLFDDDCQGVMMGNYQAALQGETRSFELAFKATGILCEYKIQPYQNAAGKIVGALGSARDITERKRAEASLKEEKNFSEALISGLPDIFYFLDPQGNFLRWNDRAMELLGVTSEEISKANALSFVHEDDRASLAGKIQEALEAGSATAEARILLKDSLRTYILTGTRLETRQGLGVVGVGIDISERKQVEEVIRESERKLLEAQKVACLGYYILDIKEGIWSCSTGLDDLFGIDDGYKRDVAGWLGIVHPDDRESLATYLYENVLSKHEKFDKEYKIINVKTGHERWVHGLGSLKFDDEGHPVSMFGTIQDITKHKQLEAQILNEKRQAQTYLDIAGMMMAVLDRKGCIKLINRKGCEILGYDEQEIIGRNWFELCIAKEMHEEVQSVFNQLMAGEVAPVEYHENTIFSKTGEERLIAFHNSILKDKNDNITGILFSGEDITERKQAADAIMVANDLRESIIEHAPVRVFWKDIESRYLGCNSLFARDAGLEHPDELIGKTDLDMGWKDQAEAYRADDRQVMESGVPKLGFEELQTTPDGNMIWLRTSKVPLRDSLGKVHGILGVYEDITASKQAEIQLKERFDEIERMNKLMIGRELKMEELRQEIKRLQEVVSGLKAGGE